MSISRFRGNSRVVALVALCAALGLGAALQRGGAIGDEPRKEVNPTPLRHAQELSDAFHNAAEVAMPSVVTIHSKTKAHPVARKGTTPSPKGDNPLKGTPFEDFFGGGGMDGFQINPRQMPRREGMGSGVIVDPSGIVLTNNHVVEGADEVVVRLADGREFKGTDIKTDPHSDLAVVRISGAGSLPAAALGNSDGLRIGDWVIAIGNPFGFEQTVSSGIISGTGRELSESGSRTRFLQTDAAINPGNSGGPLINLKGEVIGINTAIASSNGSFNGLGFAIPVNTAKWVTQQLTNGGAVQRAYLGVGLEPMSSELAVKLGARHGEGVLVAQVFPKTPAAEAGFEEGDIITKFAGQKVKERGELQSIVERTALNTAQEVEVLRDGKTVTLHVTPRAMPKEFGQADRKGRPGRSNSDDSSAYEASELGVEVTDLTADRAEELGFENETGVLVTKVDPEKAAAEQGVKAGMLITKVGKKSVKNLNDFKAALKGESIKDGIVLVVRDARGGNHFLLLKE
jgi:serine protease Do